MSICTFLPCVDAKLIKPNGKWVLEAFIQCYCLNEIPSMFYICKVWNDMLSLGETTNVFIGDFCYSKIYLHQLGLFKLLKQCQNLYMFCKVFLQYDSLSRG